MFSNTGHGFQMTFDNGWTVSVQWGPMNYCDHYSSHSHHNSKRSKTAEIAAWDANDKWYDFGNDTVKGRVSTDEVAAFIVMVADFVVKK
jgi:hypothetical protein